MSYNGFKNKETWEVYRCINNSEKLYKLAKSHTCYKDFAFDALMLAGDDVMWHNPQIDHDEINNSHIFNRG